MKWSFDLRGRTARAPHLVFLFCATLSLAASFFLVVRMLPDEQLVTGLFVILAIFYLPVTAAGVRRLHDAGESGLKMLDPLKPLIALYMPTFLIWIAVGGTGAVGVLLFAGIFIFAQVAAMLFFIVALLVTVLTLMYFSNTMGFLLLPSQPGTNRYGPNPHEVPQ